MTSKTTYLVIASSFVTTFSYSQTVALKPVTSGAMRKVGFYMPQRIRLSVVQPEGLLRAPAGLKSPRYSILEIQGKKFILILDQQANGDAKLFVDSNANGDLTDDPQPKISSHQYKSESGKPYKQTSGSAVVDINLGGKVVPASIGFYVFDKNDEDRPQLKDTFLYFADYGYEGTVKLEGKPYHVMLADEQVKGDFRPKGGSEKSGVLFLIDVNGNNKFDSRGEQYSPGKPFNIGGSTYEITGMAADGDRFDLVKSKTTVAEVLPPPSLNAGAKVISFSATSTDGKSITFPESFKGKIVMLDFWATWCGPCMGEVPNVVSAYHKYHDRGFEILGISLDNKDTIKNIGPVTAEKGMSWTQVADGKFWDAAIAKLYVIQSIPQAYLVDGDTGEILAEGEAIRGDGLQKAIEAAFAKKGKTGGH